MNLSLNRRWKRSGSGRLVVPGGGAPSFALPPGLWSGVHRLIETPMLINGAAPDPEFIFLGKDAAAGGWPSYRYPASPVTLALQAGTAPSYNQGSPFLGSLDDSVLFNGGGFFQLASAGVGDVTTQDIVLEVVAKAPIAADSGKYCVGTFATHGWVLYSTGVGVFVLYLNDGTFVQIISSTAAANLIHLLIFADRSGSGLAYANGVAGTPAVISGVAGSLSSATALFIGGKSGVQWNSAVMYAALWKQASWLDTHLQATVAKDRFAKLTGSRPMYSWAGDTSPVASGSTSPATQQKTVAGVMKHYLMGAGAPRFESVMDADGRLFVGALVEPGATQTFLQSQSLATTWTKIDVGDVITDGTGAGPDGSNTLSGIKGDSTNGQHGVSQNATVTAAAWVMSVYARAGDRNWIYIEDTTLTNCYGYFDLANGVIGTKGAGATAIGIISCGGGLYRVWMTFTGTAAAHTFRISPADADGDKLVVGDATAVNVHAGCAQLELGSYPSSYVISTTATVTRAADVLYYNLTNILGSGQGTVRFRILYPPGFPSASAQQHNLLGITNAGITEYIMAYRAASGTGITAYRQPTDGALGTSSVNIVNNKIHEVMLGIIGTRLDLWVDGVLSRFTMSSALGSMARLYIANLNGGNPSGPVLVGDIKVSPRYSASPRDNLSGFRSL